MPRQVTLEIKETTKKIKITNLAEPLEAKLFAYSGADLNIPLGFSEICLCTVDIAELFQISWERCAIMTFIIKDNIIKEHRTEKAEEQWFRIRTELQTSEPSRYETLAENQQIPIVETYASQPRLNTEQPRIPAQAKTQHTHMDIMDRQKVQRNSNKLEVHL